uniref:Uncharacterized protein n=1 Tax=Nelumbo nucifera TaxID=4432 RepID=A0A822XTI2_NELNU|nr:TPA_asm: hypothetical protein HUJ06_024785 [Nelumbo nucifera]
MGNLPRNPSETTHFRPFLSCAHFLDRKLLSELSIESGL